MLSKEKAKFKSTRLRTNSQMNKERQLKMNPIHTHGIMINLTMNPNIFFMLLILKFKEFIAVFKKSWLIVSQALVKTNKSKIKNRGSFILQHLHTF